MSRVSGAGKGNKPEKVEMVLMKSKVYRLVKGELKMRISAACFEIISARVITMIKQAAEQTKVDKRETIKPRDFDAAARAAVAGESKE